MLMGNWQGHDSLLFMFAVAVASKRNIINLSKHLCFAETTPRHGASKSKNTNTKMPIPTLPTTPAPVTTSAANMKTRSQGEAESTSMDDFIINKPRKLSATTTKK